MTVDVSPSPLRFDQPDTTGAAALTLRFQHKSLLDEIPGDLHWHGDGSGSMHDILGDHLAHFRIVQKQNV
ncbi:MAG: hypothetical protein ACRED1_12060 [Limisphaerales bacterium]